MRERKMRDLKMRHQIAGVENAVLESAGNDIVYGTPHIAYVYSVRPSVRLFVHHVVVLYRN